MNDLNPNQKEVMPVPAINNTFDSPNKLLTSPANVLSGCGATPEQAEIVRNLALFHQDESNRLGKKTTGAKPRNQKHSKIHWMKANAIEAILAEREGLLMDKARLDYFSAHDRDFRFINHPTMDGKFPAWQYYSATEGRNESTYRKTLREAIDAAMKGEG